MKLFGRKKTPQPIVISDLEMAEKLIPAIEATARCRPVMGMMLDDPRYVEGMIESGDRSPELIRILHDAVNRFDQYHADAEREWDAVSAYTTAAGSPFRALEGNISFLCFWGRVVVRNNRDMLLSSFFGKDKDTDESARGVEEARASARPYANAVVLVLRGATQREASPAKQRLVDCMPLRKVLGMYCDPDHR